MIHRRDPDRSRRKDGRGRRACRTSRSPCDTQLCRTRIRSVSEGKAKTSLTLRVRVTDQPDAVGDVPERQKARAASDFATRAVWSAERAGFEPAVGFYPHAALAKRCFRPLSHLSNVCFSLQICRFLASCLSELYYRYTPAGVNCSRRSCPAES